MIVRLGITQCLTNDTIKIFITQDGAMFHEKRPGKILSHKYLIKRNMRNISTYYTIKNYTGSYHNF